MVLAKRYGIEEIRESQDTNFLIEIFRNGSREECEAACETIVRLQKTKYPHLADALNDPDDNVRRWTTIAIGRSGERTGDPYFTAHLVHMLDDRSRAVQDSALNALKNMLNAILLDRNRAEYEFDISGLREALLAMLGSRSEAARELAYVFMQDILNEEKLLATIRYGLSTVKGEAAERLKPFHGRAMREFNRSESLPERKDDFVKKAFGTKRIDPEKSVNKARKRFVN